MKAAPYIVLLDAPSLAESILHARRAGLRVDARSLWDGLSARRASVASAARSMGAEVTFDYGRLVSGFATRMDPAAAVRVAGLPGVASVTPASTVRMYESEEGPSAVLRSAVRSRAAGGRGVRVAVIDSGVDYTHAAFGGAGTRSAYDENDPTRIERGTFPTSKVIDGYDFVGDDYEVTDNDTTNDIPKPDQDPLDLNGHGTHVASICCGKATGEVPAGRAPRSKILAFKVWDEGDSTADVLVAAFEAAVDPNGDGSLSDMADVINFSGGVDHGTAAAAESLAAQRAVDLGVVVVAATGNAGNELADGAAYRVGAPATAPGVVAVAAHNETPRVAEFSSEGPARDGSQLKPDVAAEGVGVVAAGVGTGSEVAIMSGTSMASPQVAGVAARLVASRPSWSPVRIKAALLNNASAGLRGPGGLHAPATVMGAGRMRGGRSMGAPLLAWPGSISFGRRASAVEETFLSEPLKVKNLSSKERIFSLTSEMNVSDLGPEPFDVAIVSDEGPETTEVFTLAPGKARTTRVQITFTPAEVGLHDRLMPWYGEHPDVDGAIVITMHRDRNRQVRVPWHIVPVFAEEVSVSPAALVFGPSEDTARLSVTSPREDAHVDVFTLGAPDARESGGEEDISHIAARSFAGSVLDGEPSELPENVDPFGGLTWLEFLSDADVASEPVEFLVRTHEPRDTSETITATVYIDAGNDGVYENDVLEADFKLSLTADGGSCLVDLGSGRECISSLYADYPYYDTNLMGLVAEAGLLGLSDGDSEISYRAVVCTDRFSGDVPQPVCDSAGGDGVTATLDVIDPSLAVSPQVCGGPWSAPCADGITVTKTQPNPRADLFVAFPWGVPAENFQVVPTG
jgi:hypothetical protein